MSKHLTIKNVLLKSFAETRKGCTAKIVFPLSNKVADAFGWPRELQAGSWTPEEGEDAFKALNVDLIPQNPELEDNRIALQCNGLIHDFSIVRKQIKEGKNAQKAKKMMTEVSCAITYNDEMGAGKLSLFLRGSKRAEMLLSYEPNPVQEKLPVGGEDDSQMEFEEGGPSAEARESVADMPEGDGEKPKRGRPKKEQVQ